ncbi:putative porin [Bacteroidales bacterium OttesenSCG-928-A17]|nr:putative porin [Bacteroidales bacterium OttesenSCG-928-A17]
MHSKLYIICLLLLFPFFGYGQDTTSVIVPERIDLLEQALPIDSIAPEGIVTSPDSTKKVSFKDKLQSGGAGMAAYASVIDTSRSINFWSITRRTGEMYPVVPDTLLTDYFNRTTPDGAGISVAHLGNLGLPMESRVFFDRADRSQFMFVDGLWAYEKQPDRYNFTNTKIPYSTISYQRAGSRQNMEERFQAQLAVNYGKELNFGFDVDYLYARGFYTSQGAKHLGWVLFANYISERHQLHAFINPSQHTYGENGGITEDGWITRPDTMGERNLASKEVPTKLNNTWNYIKGNKYYLNYHYNLGFERETGEIDEYDDPITQFVPVSSIIYTFDYNRYKKRFYTEDGANLDDFYNNVDYLNPNRKDKIANDSTSYHSLSNTLALSLREGFSNWAKFDLTAFITHDIRKFTLMDSVSVNGSDSLFASRKETQNSTYIGGELAKKTGKILTYNAKASFGILGENLGDMDISGHIETKIPLFKQVTTVSLDAYIKNLEPTFYENHYYSKYYRWDNDFGKVKKVFVGGSIHLPYTETKLSLGVENLTNHIYFDGTGYPKQHTDNIQILAATLEQKIKLGPLNWNTQLVYQTSSNQDIIPLPDLAAYSSLFFDFKIAKVLTVQMGGSVHYWTKYYSPTYNPATQQFTLQNEDTKIEVGNYPLISGFLNCHLKQARFFLEYYNAGSSFINPPEYFSIPHYPVNPTVLKLGISVYFIN